MSLKKKVLTTLSLVLILGLAALGILAYLMDDDSDVNVMTLGNVSIKQHEYERVVEDGAYKTETIDGVTSYVLKDFTQAKPLYPATAVDANGNPYNFGAGDYGATRVKMSQVDSHGSMDVFVNKNAQDKFVTVENTGKSDAYVRTIIAYELGSVANFRDVINTSCFMTAQGVWKATDIGSVVIDGNNYFVVEYLYNGAKNLGGVHENGVLPAGDTTYPSLAQVYMKGTATNEDCEKIDGNKNGTYDILVLSQAVQAEGFASASTALNTAFGEVNKETAEAWFEGDAFEVPEVVSSYDDLTAARGNDGDYVLSGDIKSDNIIHFGAGTDVTLDLNGKTITAEKTDQFALGAQQGGKLHLTGEGTVNMGKGFYANKGGAEIAIDGGTYNATVTATLSGMKFTSLAQNDSKIVINGGTFTTDVDNAALFFATSNATIEVNGGFFENTADKTPDLFSMGTNKYNTNRIIFKGGTFVNWNPLEDRMCYEGEWPESYDDFSGPWMLVWDGYKVVSETQANGDVWYSVVPK